MADLPSFIEYISLSNKELFHSRAIVWILKCDKEFQRNFLSTVLPQEDGKIEFVDALSEIRQIDILVLFKLNDKMQYLHVENKLKASESSKKSDAYTLNVDKSILSQTEYYYSRVCSKKFANRLIKQIGRADCDSLSNSENWRFVFLKPSFVLKGNGLTHLNSWRDDIWKNDQGKISILNPWDSFSYETLIVNNLRNAQTLSLTAAEYIEFIKKDFSKIRMGDLKNSDYLSYQNVECVLGGLSSSVEEGAMNEWFMLLKKDLHDTFTNANESFKNKLSNDFNTKFLTDTGNNGGFLIEACFIITDCEFPHNQKMIKQEGRIGIQYEHNTNGAKLKFFYAANAYDKVKPDKTQRKLYVHRVEQLISDSNFPRVSNILNWDQKFNGSKSKTFCSRSVDVDGNTTKLNYENYQELKNIFYKLIVALDDDLTENQDMIRPLL